MQVVEVREQCHILAGSGQTSSKGASMSVVYEEENL